MEGLKPIDNWAVLEEIGRGDFARVFRVRGEDGVERALKLCINTGPAAVERLQFERQALEVLSHPSIPRLITSGQFESLPYLVMELATGRTLKSAIEHNASLGRLFGDIEAVTLLKKLLSALAHVHEQGLVHRDIKDANVIVGADSDSLHLIDYGFSKAAGAGQIRSADSFWRVGAARFSPPSKLRNPGASDQSHDIFAVGVIGYRMLTGEYPWSASHDDDVSTLIHLMETREYPPVHLVNSYVLPEIAALLSRLLDLDDNRRMTAAQALAESERILERIRAVGASRIRIDRQLLSYPHVVRDPVHKDIWLTDYEYRVLLTPEMQRLRYIKQLGLANTVYPGAEHTRLGHSIGCVARVEQILRTIEDRLGARTDPEVRLAARMFALTHDVVHIPFGPTLEDELGILPRRDENQARVERLLNESSALGTELGRTDFGRAVLACLSSPPARRAEHGFVDLVVGATGADVLDYIDRDAYYCGVDHRIDAALFRQFRYHVLPRSDERKLMSELGGKYGVRVDREYLVESVLRERYAMYLKVYTHRAKTAASALLGKAIVTENLKRREGPKRRKPSLPESEIEWMGDMTLLDRLRRSRDRTVSWAADQIIGRRFPEGVYRGVLLDERARDETSYGDRRAWLTETGLGDPVSRLKLESELAAEVGVEPHCVMVYCPPKAPGHQQVGHWVTRSQHSSPTHQQSEVFTEIRRRHLGLWELWVFLSDAPDQRTRVKLADAAADRFHIPNQADVNRLQGRLF